jgi:primosomal protein N''
MSLENKKAKAIKLKNKNSFVKNSCEEHKKLLNVLKSSHGELKLTYETLLASHEELLDQHASLVKLFSKKIKKNESSSHDSSDQLQHVTNSCDVEKRHVSTSCDDLLDIPCSSHIDAYSTSISRDTNLLKENNKLKNEVKKLSNKLKRCYNLKVTFEHMMKTQRNFGDKSGFGSTRA